MGFGKVHLIPMGEYPMTRFLGVLSGAILLSVFLIPSDAYAQGMGGMGGMGSYSGGSRSAASDTWSPGGNLPELTPLEVATIISIDGTADLRVKPEEIRVVLAIIAEGETAQECQDEIAEQIEKVVEAWREMKIAEENIVEDFINVLPRYEWGIVERDGQKFRIQQRQGYRMQTNLHVAVKTEKEAMAAIKRAFEQGVTDIVTFDYWSSQVDKARNKAREAALEAAKEKAKTLLAVFDEPPKVINVQEATEVFSPHSLYRTYENVLEEEVRHDNQWNSIPSIKAYRPKMTFFQGLQSNSDQRPSGAPMHPEIAVVSTVRIYYQSPSDKKIKGGIF